MIQLFLSKPILGNGGDENSAKEMMSFLKRLEPIIWPVILSNGRYEARLWLCNTISCIPSIAPHNQRQLFVDILRYSESKREVAAQLLRMIFDKRPWKAGFVVAKKCKMLERFFQGNPRRILQWFDHFAITSESGHRKGARALSQFAFVNRDICWEELEWKGKHGQSPAVVATKPHYFHDLDVLTTVENFLEHIPEFWSSDELATSVKDGEILDIDAQFFVDKFVSWMYEEDLEDIWELIDNYLIEEQFSLLSCKLLILLDENELRNFLISLSKYGSTTFRTDFEKSSTWLENLLSMQNFHLSINELLLLNAVISQGRQLLRLLFNEEHEDEQRKIEDILRGYSSFSNVDHWCFIRECGKMELPLATKWIGLISWIVHYRLHKECKTKESYESLFSRSGIHFKMATDYSLLWPDEFSKASVAENTNAYKKGKSRKKRRKNYVSDEIDADELLEFETSYVNTDFHSMGGSWLLSTDDYSCSWSTVDLPEHLSRHSFAEWMKWVCSQRSV